MARTNKSKLAIEMIEKEIEKAGKDINESISSHNYSGVYGLSRYKDGLYQALWYLQTFGEIKKDVKNDTLQ